MEPASSEQVSNHALGTASNFLLEIGTFRASKEKAFCVCSTQKKAPYWRINIYKGMSKSTGQIVDVVFNPMFKAAIYHRTFTERLSSHEKDIETLIRRTWLAMAGIDETAAPANTYDGQILRQQQKSSLSLIASKRKSSPGERRTSSASSNRPPAKRQKTEHEEDDCSLASFMKLFSRVPRGDVPRRAMARAWSDQAMRTFNLSHGPSFDLICDMKIAVDMSGGELSPLQCYKFGNFLKDASQLLTSKKSDKSLLSGAGDQVGDDQGGDTDERVTDTDEQTTDAQDADTDDHDADIDEQDTDANDQHADKKGTDANDQHADKKGTLGQKNSSRKTVKGRPYATSEGEGPIVPLHFELQQLMADLARRRETRE